MMRLNNPPAPAQEDALEDDGYRRRRTGAKGALHAFEESGFYRPRK
jgi:hypothetical protein